MMNQQLSQSCSNDPQPDSVYDSISGGLQQNVLLVNEAVETYHSV